MTMTYTEAMFKGNYEETSKHYKLEDFRCLVKVLDIPDQYPHMHPDLIKHFEEQYEAVE